MRVLIHCEHQFGLGHYIRALSIAKACRDRGWKTVVVTGGRKMSAIAKPKGVRILQLPLIEIRDNKLVNDRGRRVTPLDLFRRATLFVGMLSDFRPDIVVTEHFPFGRWKMLKFYDPIIKALQPLREQGRVKVVASVRDIVDLSRSPLGKSGGMTSYINDNYDLVMIHCDPRLISWEMLLPGITRWVKRTAYTGFVQETHGELSTSDNNSLFWMRRQKQSGKCVILATAGGGRGGAGHLAAVIAACKSLQQTTSLALLVVTGPFAKSREFKQLKALASGVPDTKIVTQVSALRPFMAACDLSISHLGYNTAVHLLATVCKSIVIPMPKEISEQTLRALKFQKIGRCDVIHPLKATPRRMIRAIQNVIRTPSKAFPRYDCNGAKKCASLLGKLATNSD